MSKLVHRKILVIYQTIHRVLIPPYLRKIISSLGKSLQLNICIKIETFDGQMVV